ncbi:MULTISPECIES: head-tail joining protein [unclassified Methylobacterium]|jgi:hypothetical protein|uniref:head-tail joining protein n=1 Tax=unclassified Methylobacterium TaxID=2615210 RepID=UPI0013531A36|nr:hypothetical protein [Methylobacterium sp. 2A]MWV22457.1 hypothetical protein [Methylobacterium sp. 2A]
MPIPAPFRFLAKTQTRSPLADRSAVPILMDGVWIDRTPDGRDLRAICRDQTVSIDVGDREDYVSRVVVSYSLADLPREPRRGDKVRVDGVELIVGNPMAYRVGVVDCICLAPGEKLPTAARKGARTVAP